MSGSGFCTPDSQYDILVMRWLKNITRTCSDPQVSSCFCLNRESTPSLCLEDPEGTDRVRSCAGSEVTFQPGRIKRTCPDFRKPREANGPAPVYASCDAGGRPWTFAGDHLNPDSPGRQTGNTGKGIDGFSGKTGQLSSPCKTPCFFRPTAAIRRATGPGTG